MSDISDLFAKDPLDLTKENRAEITKWYRDKRANWNLTGKSPRKKPEKGSSSPLSMDDIGEL